VPSTFSVPAADRDQVDPAEWLAYLIKYRVYRVRRGWCWQMSVEGLLLSVVLGLVINEMCDVSPWCARRLVRLSVRLRYADRERRRIRADELVALIDERPGKLMKLGTSLGFLCAAVPSWVQRAAQASLQQRRSHGRLPTGVPAATLTVRNLSQLPALAVEIVTAVSELGVSRGVVSINGVWGSGKSTIVSTATEALQAAPIVRYNPWIWSEDHGRVSALDGLPDAINGSSPGLDPVATALAHWLSATPERVQTLPKRLTRRRLAAALRAAPHPVVVALDDIDRMHPEHVRQVFDAVMQTAGLPNLGYLLAFDRLVVEPLLPAGLLDRRVGEFRVELAYGTCRQRPILTVCSTAAPAGRPSHSSRRPFSRWRSLQDRSEPHVQRVATALRRKHRDRRFWMPLLSRESSDTRTQIIHYGAAQGDYNRQVISPVVRCLTPTA
jgi:hypothetical protein